MLLSVFPANSASFSRLKGKNIKNLVASSLVGIFGIVTLGVVLYFLLGDNKGDGKGSDDKKGSANGTSLGVTEDKAKKNITEDAVESKDFEKSTKREKKQI